MLRENGRRFLTVILGSFSNDDGNENENARNQYV